jgi:hypothetical protein
MARLGLRRIPYDGQITAWLALADVGVRVAVITAKDKLRKMLGNADSHRAADDTESEIEFPISRTKQAIQHPSSSRGVGGVKVV